jgi:hypothetical protein
LKLRRLDPQQLFVPATFGAATVQAVTFKLWQFNKRYLVWPRHLN